MTIESNKIVLIHYTIKDEKGNIQETTNDSRPYMFRASSDQMFPKVEQKLATMDVGEKVTINLNPADAYGEYNKEAVQITDISNFPKGAELKAGMTLLTQQQGQDVPIIIKNIEGSEVTIDFNHPMAGQKIAFEVELLEIRDVIVEEQSSSRESSHDCGCSH